MCETDLVAEVNLAHAAIGGQHPADGVLPAGLHESFWPIC
jgi:hypothetical protein